MGTKEHLVESLRALCAREGVDVVADETESSVDNIKQILAGTKLPSGSPRGVGPNLQRRLDARYPGWSGSHTAIAAPAGNLDHALRLLANALAEVPRDNRDVVATMLEKLATSGGQERWRIAALHALESGKRLQQAA